jgi:predicted RNase H-like nuclease (RuvC/YqgF family)
MAEENPAAAVDNSAEIDRLKKEIDLLKQKNREVVEEKQKITSNAKSVATLPEGTDVQALIEFKQKVEQERLEEKGQYSEALNKREEQFKEAIEKKDNEINSLKNELKELKLVTPAVSALSELVHDPDYAMSKLDKEKIQVQKDGAVVYMSDDGFTSKPIQEAVKEKVQNWALKNQPPIGSGAPIGKAEIPGSIAGIDTNLLKRMANGEDTAAHEIHAKYGRDAWLAAKKIAKDYK